MMMTMTITKRALTIRIMMRTTRMMIRIRHMIIVLLIATMLNS